MAKTNKQPEPKIPGCVVLWRQGNSYYSNPDCRGEPVTLATVKGLRKKYLRVKVIKVAQESPG